MWKVNLQSINSFINDVFSSEHDKNNTMYHHIDWNQQLSKHGYVSVSWGFNEMEHLSTIHKWCDDQFGKDHYAWTGSLFWFETEQDAAIFVLRWI